MHQLLLGTSNKAKIAEISLYLKHVPIKLVSLTDVSCTADAPETGHSFEENALQKAHYYQLKTGLPVLTDDGGIEIDALNGEPGVDAHRWVSKTHDDPDEDLIAYTFARMKNVPIDKRGAQMRLVLCLLMPHRPPIFSEGVIRGIIATKPWQGRTEGFPYRSVFYLPEIHKYYNHELLTKEESNRLNHRKRAIDKLIPEINRLLLS